MTSLRSKRKRDLTGARLLKWEMVITKQKNRRVILQEETTYDNMLLAWKSGANKEVIRSRISRL